MNSNNKIEEHLLDIVILTFNNYKELISTLESVPEKYLKFVYVVNGGTCSVTREYLIESGLRHITEPDKGIADGFNKGVKNTNGLWVHFLNSGDLLLNTKMYEELENLIKYDYVFSNLIFMDHLMGNLVRIPNFSLKKDIGEGVPFCHQALIVKREIFNRVGFFDLKFKIGMDYDWEVRMLKINPKGYYISEETILMNGDGVSSKNEKSGIYERAVTLKQQKMFNLKRKFFVYRDYLKIFLKSILISYGLDGIVKFIKNNLRKI